MLNQDIHKNLRRNKPGIPLENVQMLSPSYIRPPGFMLVPTLLSSSSGNDSDKQGLIKNTSTSGSSFYQYIKDDKPRFDPILI